MKRDNAKDFESKKLLLKEVLISKGIIIGIK